MVTQQFLRAIVVCGIASAACVRAQPPDAASTSSLGSTAIPTVVATPAATATTNLATSTAIPSPTAELSREVHLELVGQIGGTSHALALRNQYAYMAVGIRLVTLDVTDPSSPKSLGESDPLPGLIENIDLANDHAIVLTDDHSLSVINIVDPKRLLVVGSLKLEPSAYDIAVADGFVYVANGEAGLIVVDISTPASPRQVGAFKTLTSATAVAVSGKFVILGEGNQLDQSGAVEVVDITDPTAPHGVDSIELSYVNAVTTDGKLALVATYGLQIVDISDPTNVRLLGTFSWLTLYDDVAFAGDLAFVSSSHYCDVVAVCPQVVTVLDISDPMAPFVQDTLPLPTNVPSGPGRGIVIQNGLVYLASDAGLRILVGQPWKSLGEYLTMGPVFDIAASMTYAFGVDGQQKLQIVDITNPAIPTVISMFSGLAGSPIQIQLADNLLVIRVDVSLALVDVSQPSQPRLLSQIETNNSVFALNSHTLYEIQDAVGGSQLSVYDISAPTEPSKLSSLQIPRGGYTWLFIIEQYLMLGSEKAIEIIDIGDSTSPHMIGEMAIVSPETSQYTAIAVSGNRVFLIRQSSSNLSAVELLVYEFAPVAMHLLATVPLTHSGTDLTIAGKYVYIVGPMGVMVVDISNPEQPIEVGASDYGGRNIEVRDDEVIVAGAENGLLIFRTETEVLNGH